MARPAASYRQARRDDARKAKLSWRALPSGISADGSILIALGLQRPPAPKPVETK